MSEEIYRYYVPYLIIAPFGQVGAGCLFTSGTRPIETQQDVEHLNAQVLAETHKTNPEVLGITILPWKRLQ